MFVIFVAVSDDYYEKAGQYGTGERRDSQLRSRFVDGLKIFMYIFMYKLIYKRI